MMSTRARADDYKHALLVGGSGNFATSLSSKLAQYDIVITDHWMRSAPGHYPTNVEIVILVSFGLSHSLAAHGRKLSAALNLPIIFITSSWAETRIRLERAGFSVGQVDTIEEKEEKTMPQQDNDASVSKQRNESIQHIPINRALASGKPGVDPSSFKVGVVNVHRMVTKGCYTRKGDRWYWRADYYDTANKRSVSVWCGYATEAEAEATVRMSIKRDTALQRKTIVDPIQASMMSETILVPETTFNMPSMEWYDESEFMSALSLIREAMTKHGIMLLSITPTQFSFERYITTTGTVLR